ncbi:GxxExxY protein [bacterium]|nr:GxxExxY protein [bacterium]
MPESLIFKEETYRIMGGCFAVYRDKGHGFVEPVYQDCMEIELEHLGIPFDPQRNLVLHYRDKALRHGYIPDLVCFDQIIVELKAVKELTDEHRAQVLNYLKATGTKLGLLVNFGHRPGLQWERIVLTR